VCGALVVPACLPAFSGFWKGELCVRQAVEIWWCTATASATPAAHPIAGRHKECRNGHISGSCFGYTCRCWLAALFSEEKKRPWYYTESSPAPRAMSPSVSRKGGKKNKVSINLSCLFAQV